MAKNRNRTTATAATSSKASDNGGLVCVANTSARLLTINLPRNTKGGTIIVNRVRLVPGNNLVDKAVWAEAEKLEFTKNHIAAGNISTAAPDVKRAQDVSAKVEDEAQDDAPVDGEESVRWQ